MTYFEQVWSPFFETKQKVWFEKFYMHCEETDLFDAVSTILSDMDYKCRYQWVNDLMTQVLRLGPYPAYFDKVFWLVFSSWDPVH